MPESDVAVAVDLLQKIETQTQSRQWDQKLSDFSHVEELFSKSPQVQRQALIALMNRMLDSNSTACRVINDTTMGLVERLLKRKLPLEERDLLAAIQLAYTEEWTQSYTIKALERFAEHTPLSSDLQQATAKLQNPIDSGWRSSGDKQKLVNRVFALLGEEADQKLQLDENDVWARMLLDNLHQLENNDARAMRKLVMHAGTASGGKPSEKWLKEAEALRTPLDRDFLAACLSAWIAAFDQPRVKVESPRYRANAWTVSEINADPMKGLIWLASTFTNDEIIRAVSSAGLSGQRKIPGIGPRSAKISNAAIWTLSQINSPLAIGQLAIMRSKITNKSTQKVIDKAIRTVAERLQVPADEVEEMAVPTYGLAEVGRRTEQLGDFRVELIVAGTTSTELRWIKPNGKPQKTVPKAVKDDFSDELKELKAASKDIQKILPAQRDRIDLLHLRRKTWPYPVWAERYLNHTLVGTLARRLIWSFSFSDNRVKIAATWSDGNLVDAKGSPIAINEADCVVSLWHPIGQDQNEVLAWRRFFEEREIRQPFKQAHREVYLLTDAERNTGTYSNRFASHIIKQHQYNALCAIRGWRNTLRLCVDDEYPPTSIDLPEWNLRAEFWVEGVGDEYGRDTNETGTYHYLSTDQVRFYSIDAAQLSAHAGGGGYGWGPWREGNEPAPIPLTEVPELVLSEIMRDVDLFVGVASVGNDPNWQDGGPEGRHQEYWHHYSFGDLSATAQTRRAILEKTVSRLKISDRCSFDEKFLIVRGDHRVYKIHLGSSNIMMEPNDQYLCIVPSRGAGRGDKVFLPFEGDQCLAVILSKAMMLAEDSKIKDPTILSQIGVGRS